jgi:hypothetical protein
MTDQSVHGLDVNGTHLWVIQPDGEGWLGTGRNELLLHFLTLRQAVDTFIGRYPGTDHVQGIVGGQYRHADLSQAARQQLVTGIMSELEGGDAS